MEIILLEKVLKVGAAGEIVKVKDGYGRNFLLPQGKALRATESNKKLYEDRKKELEAENQKKIATAKQHVGTLENKFIVQIRQAGEDGRLFGSVTSKDVTEAILNEFKVDIKRTQVNLSASVKSTGIYDAIVTLHPEVIVTMHVIVARTESEAEEAKKAYNKPKATAEEAA